MTSRLSEIQTEIFNRLSNHAPLLALSITVHDFVPDKSPVPYITFGDMSSSSRSEYTKTSGDERVTFILEVWSENKGRKEILAIIKEMEIALKNNLALPTAHIIDQRVMSRSVRVVPEIYSLYHGIVELELLIEWEE